MSLQARGWKVQVLTADWHTKLAVVAFPLTGYNIPRMFSYLADS